MKVKTLVFVVLLTSLALAACGGTAPTVEMPTIQAPLFQIPRDWEKYEDGGILNYTNAYWNQGMLVFLDPGWVRDDNARVITCYGSIVQLEGLNAGCSAQAITKTSWPVSSILKIFEFQWGYDVAVFWDGVNVHVLNTDGGKYLIERPADLDAFFQTPNATTETQITTDFNFQGNQTPMKGIQVTKEELVHGAPYQICNGTCGYGQWNATSQMFDKVVWDATSQSAILVQNWMPYDETKTILPGLLETELTVGETYVVCPTPLQSIYIEDEGKELTDCGIGAFDGIRQHGKGGYIFTDAYGNRLRVPYLSGTAVFLLIRPISIQQ